MMDPRALLEPKKGKGSGGSKTTQSQTKREKGTDGFVRHLDSPTSPKASKTPMTTKSPTAMRTFDPKALLNPRGYKSGVKGDSMIDNDAAKARESPSHIPGTTNDSAVGFGFLERLHGTELRVAERPAKRQKVSVEDHSDDVKQQPSTSFRHGNAGVGSYFKPRAVMIPPETSNVSAAIDLTLDEDEDEDKDEDDDGVQITEVRNLADQEVCYGMIDGSIQAYKIPKPQSQNAFAEAHNQWPVFKISVQRIITRGVTIECRDPGGVQFGNIEEDLAQALAPAMDGFPKLRVQCRMMTRPKRVGEVAHQACSERFKVLFNLYGRKADVEKIGRWFGQKNIWFKSPMVSDPGVPIQNPHAQKRAAMQQQRPAINHAVNITRTAEEAADAVSKLFDYQSQNNDLPETEAPPIIITPLLLHQKQALTFMLARERPRTFDQDESGNSSLWRRKYDSRGRIQFEEVVTGLTVPHEPAQCLGGLLADVMGLGKTIQGLALIASTMDAAKEFGGAVPANTSPAEESPEMNSRATLIVAPVSTVKNWEDQIRDHTAGDSISYHVYHGSGRIKDTVALADHDVIITTYGTAAYELFGKNAADRGLSPLQKISWFRIMLDEAHTIREPKSSQARAMCHLHASRRWCLTGTPIQNRMEDLGSLTIFLRLTPYETLAKFKQYVQGPAQSGDPAFLKRLRVFVDSFTLRRLRDRVELPEKVDLTVSLEFSPSERQLHDFFREKFSVAIKRMSKSNGPQSTGAQYHRVLSGITLLRLICDHGKELLKREHLDEYKGSQPDEAIDVDAEHRLPPLSELDALDHFNLLVDADADFCAQCGRHVTDESPGSPACETDLGAERPLAVMLPCKEVFCMECCTKLFPRDSIEAAGQPTNCASCGLEMEAQFLRIPRNYLDELSRLNATCRNERNLFKNGRYEGPHTKTRALVQDIKEMQQESLSLEELGEAPIKCVVFSEFTSHLDLIEKALTDAGMREMYVRIDGSMSLSSRRKIMDELNDNNNVTILLASIKAAGQGLNLTAASRAYIMEPMWNPAAESQAVDRVYRIGQNRRVIVKRFRMNDSIEDKIVALQDRKKKLADMSLEKSVMHKALSKKEKNEQSIKAMLDIFRS